MVAVKEWIVLTQGSHDHIDPAEEAVDRSLAEGNQVEGSHLVDIDCNYLGSLTLVCVYSVLKSKMEGKAKSRRTAGHPSVGAAPIFKAEATLTFDVLLPTFSSHFCPLCRGKNLTWFYHRFTSLQHCLA